MFKASRTLLKVATIVGTIVGALLFATVPFFFVIGFSPTIRNMLIKAMDDGTITVHGSLSFDEIVLILQAFFVVIGFVLLIIGAMCVINAIISSKARQEPTRNLYIACIVTGALSTNFSLIAGIFGLICLANEERQKRFEE